MMKLLLILTWCVPVREKHFRFRNVPKFFTQPQPRTTERSSFTEIGVIIFNIYAILNVNNWKIFIGIIIFKLSWFNKRFTYVFAMFFCKNLLVSHPYSLYHRCIFLPHLPHDYRSLVARHLNVEYHSFFAVHSQPRQ